MSKAIYFFWFLFLFIGCDFGKKHVPPRKFKWEKVNHDNYSFEYPNDWELTTYERTTKINTRKWAHLEIIPMRIPDSLDAEKVILNSINDIKQNSELKNRHWEFHGSKEILKNGRKYFSFNYGLLDHMDTQIEQIAFADGKEKYEAFISYPKNTPAETVKELRRALASFIVKENRIDEDH